MTDITVFIDQLRHQLKLSHQRHLVVLAGEQSWAISELSHYLEPDQTYWLGQGDWPSCIAPNKAKSVLGSECQHLVYNCYSGLNPDAFGAVSGTLVGGGLCFLIIPPIAQWPEYNDPDYTRYVATNELVGEVSPNFIRRAIKLIEQHPQCYVLTPDGELPLLSTVVAVKDQENVDAPYASMDQQNAVAEVIQTITGHRRRPLVVSADRGRGKSAALGLAAAQLLMTKLTSVIVTAPNVGAVQCLFQHAASVLDGAKIDKLGVSWGDKRISFVAPDLLIATLPPCELLLVDEAAAIPTPMLATLARHYSRLVFATTIHGYEGTGRGFALRFLKQLRTIAPSYRRIELTQPIRWANDDPFEQFTFALLGLNSQAANVDSLVAESNIEFKIIEQPQLLADPQLLEQLFGLLVLAHYQTSPSDFRQLLDAPDLTIFVATIDQQVVATALVLKEGAIDVELQQQIWLGTRRLRGHLIPQSLIAQLNLRQAGNYRYGRIMRIAVQPQLQQQGIARQLDRFITQWATEQQLDFVGASFGATAQLTYYWQALGYQSVRLGINRDSASGTHSVIMLKAMARNPLIELAQVSFYQEFRYALTSEFKSLEVEMVVCLLKQYGAAEPLSPQDQLNIEVFIETTRPFELVAASVSYLVWHLANRLSLLPEASQQILVNKVLQQHDWPTCVEVGDHRGRKSAETALKHAVKQLSQLM